MAGVLKPMPKNERFQRPTASSWQAIFEAGMQATSKPRKPRSRKHCSRSTSHAVDTRQPAHADRNEAEWEAVERHLASLGEVEVEQINGEALSTGAGIALDGYKRATKQGNVTLARQYQQQMVVDYLRKIRK